MLVLELLLECWKYPGLMGQHNRYISACVHTTAAHLPICRAQYSGELTDSVKISTEKISYAVVDNYGLTNLQLKAQQCAMISHNSACFENIATNIKSLQLIFSIVNQICSSLDP